MADSTTPSLVPALVPGNLISEFSDHSPEKLRELSQAIYVRTTTDEPRQPIIDELLRRGWSSEAASFLYTQIKSKGPEINFVIERPAEAPDLEYEGPATAQDFRGVAIAGVVLIIGSIIFAMVVTGRSQIYTGIGTTIGVAMVLQGITRSKKRY